MATQETDSEETLYDSNDYRSSTKPNYAFSRRKLLASAGFMVTTGATAGCIGNTTQDSGGDTDGDGETSIDEWLSNTGNYDSIRDLTGRTAVEVEVGAQGNAGQNAFAPAAIRVTAKTTVTWTWIDGHHNVIAENGEFSSGDAEQNATFEYVFGSPGTYLYSCTPHESIGMKGVVVVEESTDEADN